MEQALPVHLKGGKMKKILYEILSILACVFGGFLDACAINIFLSPSNFISGGFVGLSLLTNQISGGIISVSLMIICLNVPFVILCFKALSLRFTLLSIVYIVSSSFFVSILKIPPLFTDPLLNALYGGVLTGFASVAALSVDGSAGGTDLLALYFSNKLNKSLWQYVFVFNATMFMILGFTKGWEATAYSIILQVVATVIISNFHKRYKRITLQIMTTKPNEVIEKFISLSKHGLTCQDGYGGFSKNQITMITTVISSYEQHMLTKSILQVDPDAIINVLDTANFYGKFVQKAY